MVGKEQETQKPKWYDSLSNNRFAGFLSLMLGCMFLLYQYKIHLGMNEMFVPSIVLVMILLKRFVLNRFLL